MARKQRIDIIKKIQKKRQSKVLCYLTSDRQNASAHFAKDTFPIFGSHLNNDECENIDLFIFTLGGDILAAFGLNRLLREYANRINVLIPNMCISAGTLFALGCDQILMTKTSVLGPIDPSINRPLNPAVNINGQVQQLPLSVESVAGFKGLVSDEWGIKKQPELSTILKLLSEKVHPLALGDVYRVRQQIELLATNLLKLHRTDDRNIKKIVKKLTKELGSHDYLIFRKEAKELLKDQVIIDNEIGQLIGELYRDFVEEMELGIPFDPNRIIQQQSKQEGKFRTVQVELKLAAIESDNRSDMLIDKRLLREVAMSMPPSPHGNIPMMGVKQELQDYGWRCLG